MEHQPHSRTHDIVINKRQASLLAALLLLVGLFVFIFGYFLGKKSALDELSANLTQESFAHQIDFLMTTQQQDVEDSQDSSDIEEDVAQKEENSEQTEQKPLTAQGVAHDIIQTHKSEMQKVLNEANPDTMYYAILIGFGTKKAATAFVARLKKHNIPVLLKTRISKTPKGQRRIWYQATTKQYSSKEELEAIVASIQRLEHIQKKDITIKKHNVTQ